MPQASRTERNPTAGPGSQESARLDFRFEDLADDDTLNRVLWVAIKGERAPYPGPRRMPGLEWKRLE